MFQRHFCNHIQEMISDTCGICFELTPLLGRRDFFYRIFICHIAQTIGCYPKYSRTHEVGLIDYLFRVALSPTYINYLEIGCSIADHSGRVV
jgi:hypothetical protein